VATRIATERGETQQTPHEREQAGDVLGGNSLEFGVSAIAAVRVERKAKRNWTGVKTLLTHFTSPRKDIDEAEQIVGHGASLGAADLEGAAAWTGNRQSYAWYSTIRPIHQNSQIFSGAAYRRTSTCRVRIGQERRLGK